MLKTMRFLRSIRSFLFGQATLDDTPVPFGYKAAWLAVQATEVSRTVAAINLRKIRRASWRRGVHLAQERSGVFVTPPVSGWTLAVGVLPEVNDPAFLGFMESVSRHLELVYYFGTHRVVEYHAWARAANGRVDRAFGYLGESGEFLIDIGSPAVEEIELGTGVQDQERCPNEETVLRLAAKWTVDPRELESHPEALGPGFFGSL